MNRGEEKGRRSLWWIALCAVLLATTVSVGQAAEPELGDLAQVQPTHDAYASDRVIAPPPADRLVGVVLSLGSAMLNVVFTPIKLGVGIVGAEVGGANGLLAGGDVEAAAGIWNVTTDGSYFVTPARLDGRDTFAWGGDIR